MVDLPPDVPPQYAFIVVAEAAQPKDPAKTDRTIGVCHLVDNRPDEQRSAVNHLSPVGTAWSYFKRQEKIAIDESEFKAAKFTLLQAPEHGTLEMGTRGAQYHPVDDYVGVDRATVLVEIGKYKVKVTYHFSVMQGVPPAGEQGRPTEDKRYCPNGPEWRISTK